MRENQGDALETVLRESRGKGGPNLVEDKLWGLRPLPGSAPNLPVAARMEGRSQGH